MAYETVSELAHDGDIQQRLIACAAVEGIENPEQWVMDHRWELAAQPGWADAYLSAQVSFIDRPGLRPGAISDGMILSAVQALNTSE